MAGIARRIGHLVANSRHTIGNIGRNKADVQTLYTQRHRSSSFESGVADTVDTDIALTECGQQDSRERNFP
jgi:hypothetical protein